MKLEEFSTQGNRLYISHDGSSSPGPGMGRGTHTHLYLLIAQAVEVPLAIPTYMCGLFGYLKSSKNYKTEN